MIHSECHAASKSVGSELKRPFGITLRYISTDGQRGLVTVIGANPLAFRKLN
jgi:hypothetical protein